MTTKAPPLYLSGFCNPSNPDDSHRRCPGQYGDSPCACDREGCTCRERRLSHNAAALLQQHDADAATVAAAAWTWEADAAAELMLQPGDCPMCTQAWDAHVFHDDGRVACP